MGKHRPVSQRIEQVQQQLAALMAKSVKTEVSSDPRIAEIDAKTKKINSELIKWTRYLAVGATKVKNFEERAEMWRFRSENASVERDRLLAEASELRNQRKSIVDALAAEMSKSQGA